jgi:hypothetical protein
MKHTLWFVC